MTSKGLAKSPTIRKLTEVLKIKDYSKTPFKLNKQISKNEDDFDSSSYENLKPNKCLIKKKINLLNSPFVFKTYNLSPQKENKSKNKINHYIKRILRKNTIDDYKKSSTNIESTNRLQKVKFEQETSKFRLKHTETSSNSNKLLRANQKEFSKREIRKNRVSSRFVQSLIKTLDYKYKTLEEKFIEEISKQKINNRNNNNLYFTEQRESKYVIDYLLKLSEFMRFAKFYNIDEEALTDLSMYITFKEIAKNTVLIKYKNENTNLFGIISGRIVLSKMNILKHSKYSNSNRLDKHDFIISQVDFDKFILNNNEKNIKTITKGALFGDDGLLHNSLKLESAIAIEETKLFMIDAIAINKVIMRSILKSEQDKKIKLFDYFIPFQIIKKKKIDEIFKKLIIREYSKNEIVYEEGGSIDNLYIIYQGSCNLVKYKSKRIILPIDYNLHENKLDCTIVKTEQDDENNILKREDSINSKSSSIKHIHLKPFKRDTNEFKTAMNFKRSSLINIHDDKKISKKLVVKPNITKEHHVLNEKSQVNSYIESSNIVHLINFVASSITGHEILGTFIKNNQNKEYSSSLIVNEDHTIIYHISRETLREIMYLGFNFYKSFYNKQEEIIKQHMNSNILLSNKHKITYNSQLIKDKLTKNYNKAIITPNTNSNPLLTQSIKLKYFKVFDKIEIDKEKEKNYVSNKTQNNNNVNLLHKKLKLKFNIKPKVIQKRNDPHDSHKLAENTILDQEYLTNTDFSNRYENKSSINQFNTITNNISNLQALYRTNLLPRLHHDVDKITNTTMLSNRSSLLVEKSQSRLWSETNNLLKNKSTKSNLIYDTEIKSNLKSWKNFICRKAVGSNNKSYNTGSFKIPLISRLNISD